MIKVKQFAALDENVDSKINKFLASNNVEIVDIKFQTVGTDRRTFNTALLIYKDGGQDEE